MFEAIHPMVLIGIGVYIIGDAFDEDAGKGLGGILILATATWRMLAG